MNGDSPVPTRIIKGVSQPVASTTAEQHLARKNELKARGTLLMALPDKHQLKFNSHKDAKTLMEAIEKRFVLKVWIRYMTSFKSFLPSEWKTHTLIWRNKANLEEQNLDDLFNSLKIYKTKVKQSSSSGTATQNLAFVSSTSTNSTTDSFSAAASVSAACVKLPASSLPNIDVDDLEEMDLRWQMAMLTMRSRRFLQKIDRNLGANGPTSMGFDMSKVECYNYHRKGHFARECRYPKDPRRPDTAEPQRRTVLVETSTSNALVSKCDESNCESLPPSNLYNRFQPSGGYHVVPPLYTGTFMPPKPDLVFNTAPIPVKTDHLTFNVSDFEEDSEPKDPQQFVPSFAQSSEHVKTPRHYVQPIETTFQAATSVPASPKSNSSGKRRNRKDCFVCKSVDHLIKDCDYHSKKMAQPTPRNYANMGHHKQYVPLTQSKPQKHRVPPAVLTQSKPVSNTAVRPVSAAFPNITVTRPRHANQVVPVVSVAPGKQGTWGNPQLAFQDKGVIDSGCSRHMTGNMSYLFDFEELNGGYVAFGGNPKSGKITCKGKIKTMLLRVPRENSMYNVNLKNIVPSGDLTCLFSKATLDESNLWHTRLARVNFKTINKLVKGNLVRGLPIKVFENDHTCVVCKKCKQQRVSCKTKPVSSGDQPLFRLHMDLFGPTFIKSLNKKSYCLVIIDDYNRFTWVFFLATKDETRPILKTFITGLENQLSLKVKVIRSDNRTEFKNFDLNHFYLLLPIPIWAEAVNTACYVQNRVLVTKPHNKTPYELLHGRTPSIGFMRPFGCPVTILNTLDHLGKFQGNVNEGFLIGYSVCSKAFRVFNSRTRIIQETLHVNFLENKPNVAGTSPTWMFDINSLSGTMNYHPVTAGNQTNSSAGFQDKFNAEKAEDEVDQSYMLFPVWSFVGSINPQNNAEDAAFDEKEHDFDVKKPESKFILSPSRYRDLNAEFQGYSNNSSNEVTTASSRVPTVGQNSLNNTNTFSVAGPSNTAVSPTYRDASQFPDDPNMPRLEDIIYSGDEDVVGAKADFNNLESSIPVSPIPTTRIHKDHPVSQIIGNDFHTCMFTCFLLQEEPKRAHQALKDPSWIEAMQEELF
nr:hypothetical protein [Tanacetum cinerariifolium]